MLALPPKPVFTPKAAQRSSVSYTVAMVGERTIDRFTLQESFTEESNTLVDPVNGVRR